MGTNISWRRRWLMCLAVTAVFGGIMYGVSAPGADARTHADDDVPPLSEPVVEMLEHDGFVLGGYDSKRPSWVQESRKSRIDTNQVDANPLDQASAITGAEQALGLSTADVTVVAASLTTLTTPDVGYEQQPDTELPSDIQALWTNTSTWAVQFSGIQIPVLGPVGTPSATYTTGMVVFVDAYDGSLMITTQGPSASS